MGRRSLGGLVGAAVVAAMAVAAPEAAAVIGGRSAAPGEAPYAVSLIDPASGFHSCGGSVVAADWILTAAHCVDDKTPATVQAVTGRLRRSDTASGQVHTIAAIHVHPAYDAANARNDVALLQLVAPTSAPPVALATAADDALEAPGTPTTVYGWGATLVPVPGLAGLIDSPDVLMAATVPIVDDASCRAIYQLTLTNLLPIGSAVPTPADHVCAAALLRDSCFGDSGGPLVAATPAGPVQVGVVSTGLLCALPTHPGIYVEVNSPTVLSWIDATISP